MTVMHRYIKCRIIAGLLVLAAVFTGCSSGGTEHTKVAFENIEKQSYEEALSEFLAAEEAKEDERLILRGRGIAYLGMGRYPEAIQSFEQSLALSDGILGDMDFDINYYLATAYYKNSDVDSAIEIYNRILNLRPNEAEALYLRGVLYAEKEDLTSAGENFDKAISLEPENYDMIIKIYSILAENGYKDVAQDYLKNAMENGTKKMSNFEKGQISFYLEDYESAKTYFEKARDENELEAVLFLGKTYEILGDVNYAISVYSSYNSADAPDSKLLNQMGLCKLRTGDYEGALMAFQQALSEADNDMLQTLKFNEVVAYEYLGDFKKACVLLESYMKSFPDDAEAKREYQFLKTR